jgi:exopolysaccharide production protein ExoZ
MTSNISFAPKAIPGNGIPGSARNRAIDGFRGLFALLVFLAHFHVQFHLLTHNRGALYFLSSALWCITRAAVGIFFALSGFLFYGSLLKRPEPYFTFVGKRLRRLYPTFLFAFSVYLLFCLVFPSASKLPAHGEARFVYIAANLLMLQGLLHPPLIVQTWTLTFTCAFYLALPAVAWGFGKFKLGSAGRLRCLAALWVAGLCSLLVSGVMTNGIGFITGMVVAEALPWLKGKASGMGRRAELLAAILVAAACIMLYAAFSWHAQFIDAAMPPTLFSFYAVACRVTVLSLMTVVVFTLALENNGLTRRILSSGLLAGLGTISYSWYLMHGVALKVVGYMVEKAHTIWRVETALLFVPALLLSLLFAWAVSSGTYHLIETRAIRTGRKVLPQSAELSMSRGNAG